jgi:glycosyltransferase involved in cell wall biosynthesis
MTATPSLSIVIPAYNEAARLAETLELLLRFLNRYPGSELIVVDDGSTDRTEQVADHCLRASELVSSRVIRHQRNRGKGHALRTGLLAARSPIALFTDADLSTPVTEFPRIVEPILSGHSDIAFGSRALDRSLTSIRQPWLRETAGRAFNLVMRAATGLPFRDTQCGLKAFRMNVSRPIFRAAGIDRFAFDVEWLYVAHRAGLRLQEIPVRWNHSAGSKVSMRRDSLRMLHDLVVIRRQANAGAYDEAIAEIRLLTQPTALDPALHGVDRRSAIA